jgi:hypothetical protein
MRRVTFPPLPVQPRPLPRPPEFGAISPTDPHPAVVRRSDDEVLNGFLAQQVRLQLGNRLICVTASQGSDECFPFEHPVLLVSTTVTDYTRLPDDLGVDFLPAVAVAGDRQWLDRMIIVRDGPAGRDVARRFDAPYLLVWDAAGMTVCETDTGRVVRQFSVRARELTYRCCPLIADAAPGDRCRMYGGGSVSRAIVAAGYWLDRRYVFLEELGCDEVCGEASLRQDPKMPTRYLTWLTEREIAQQWAGIVSMASSD